jgi:hypothetical protein
MWQNGKVGDITVYVQRKDGISYEIYFSKKLEVIVRNQDMCTTHYYRFDATAVKNYRNEFYDDKNVEALVESIPELDQLPKDIAAKLQAGKKRDIPKPETPTEQD